MLSQRIVTTLRFFDLQGIPLTLFELHKFLLSEIGDIKQNIDTEFEVLNNLNSQTSEYVSIDKILFCLENELKQEVESKSGYYCLRGRVLIIDSRLNNYFYGFKRERRVRRYLWLLKYLPFIRGVGIGGSQALGQQKEKSDIDLLIITDEKFMWLARTLVSGYFQIFGVRRYLNNTENRFCLNHYLAKPKKVDRERNLYKAMEYLRLRPVVYGQTISEYQKNNIDWIKVFFPNAQIIIPNFERQSGLQVILEKIFTNKFGKKLEDWLKKVETKRIKQDKYTFITTDELSFHPESRHNQLLENFFQN